jgi:hypothetical protein
VPALFQPSPILQVQRLCLHLSTLKHRRKWLADAVVATDHSVGERRLRQRHCCHLRCALIRKG